MLTMPHLHTKNNRAIWTAFYLPAPISVCLAESIELTVSRLVGNEKSMLYFAPESTVDLQWLEH